MKKALLKSVVTTISLIAPALVVNFAYKQLANPQIKKLRPREIEVLNTAVKETFKFLGFDIQLYTWGQGSKRVLLIHGWEGQAGNFADIIKQLLEHDYTVYAFDGPSHGFSSQGETSLFEFADLVGELIRKFRVKKLVSHSFGSVATTYALHQNKGFEIDRYVLLTTPDRFIERIEEVSAQVGITDKVKRRLIARIENEMSVKVDDLNVSDYVKTINVAKALIIHDKNDTVIPISRSRNVHRNWRNCDFLEVERTGHFRILRTNAVISRTIDFLDA